MNRLLITVILSMFLAIATAAQGQQIAPADRAAIASVWNDIAVAVQKKDRKALEHIYAEDFYHVHAIGKIDDRKTRLDALLSGEPTIDTAGEASVGLRKFGDTVIAVGTISTTDDGKPVTYAVTRVYVRQKGRWLFASSHASAVVPN